MSPLTSHLPRSLVGPVFCHHSLRVKSFHGRHHTQHLRLSVCRRRRRRKTQYVVQGVSFLIRFYFWQKQKPCRLAANVSQFNTRETQYYSYRASAAHHYSCIRLALGKLARLHLRESPNRPIGHVRLNIIADRPLSSSTVIASLRRVGLCQSISMGARTRRTRRFQNARGSRENGNVVENGRGTDNRPGSCTKTVLPDASGRRRACRQDEDTRPGVMIPQSDHTLTRRDCGSVDASSRGAAREKARGGRHSRARARACARARRVSVSAASVDIHYRRHVSADRTRRPARSSGNDLWPVSRNGRAHVSSSASPASGTPSAVDAIAAPTSRAPPVRRGPTWETGARARGSHLRETGRRPRLAVVHRFTSAAVNRCRESRTSVSRRQAATVAIYRPRGERPALTFTVA